ncbi:MAG: PASTA domain-containing protein [Myxococcota bacterium]
MKPLFWLTCALFLLSSCRRVHRVLTQCSGQPDAETCTRWRGGEADIEIKRGDTSVPLREGLKLLDGDTITVGDDHVVILRFRPGVQLAVMPGSRVSIRSFHLEFGKVLIRIRDYIRRKMGVRYESYEAAPDRTEFSCAVEEGGDFIVEVLEGTVRVTDADADELLASVPAGSRVAVGRTIPDPSAITVTPVDADVLRRQTQAWNRIELAAHPERPRLLVPDVQGLQKIDAIDVLDQARLRNVEVDWVPGAAILTGKVLNQRPLPGQRVRKGRNIRLEAVSESITMPSLLRQRRREAEAQLKELKLVPRDNVRATVTCRVPSGTVSRQRPEVGETVTRGTKVRLWIEGPSTRVPPVVDQDPKEALRLLTNAGLQGSTKDVESTAVKKRTVTASDPPVNTCVSTSQAVSLTVALPAREVPPLSRPALPAKDAQAELENQGFIVSTAMRPANCARYRGPSGRVAHTIPEAGELVLLERPVVSLARFAPSARVPEIIRTPPATARRRLAGVKLRSREIEVEVRRDYQGGKYHIPLVQGSQPGEGRWACLSEPVEVTIEVPVYRLPDVVSLGEAAARRQVEQAGFVVEVQYAKPRCDKGRNAVCAQTPAANQDYAPGTKVTLTVNQVIPR